jgi:hypothetical protein
MQQRGKHTSITKEELLGKAVSFGADPRITGRLELDPSSRQKKKSGHESQGA